MWRFDAQASVANGFIVCAPCDEDDVVTMLCEPGADNSTDGTGAEHYEAHEVNRILLRLTAKAPGRFATLGLCGGAWRLRRAAVSALRATPS
jgi:hypothetical protein